eukprot:s2653_g14.t1
MRPGCASSTPVRDMRDMRESVGLPALLSLWISLDSGVEVCRRSPGQAMDPRGLTGCERIAVGLWNGCAASWLSWLPSSCDSMLPR